MIQKILKPKLNSGNVVKPINSRVVAVVRHGIGLVEWTKKELRKIDRNTTKTMTMHRALYLHVDLDRLYIPIKMVENELLILKIMQK